MGTTVRDGTPSMTPAIRNIHHNFFVDNYSPQENVDNDDGSAYYNTHDNFLVYGGQGMKNDFGGHDNYHHDNIYAKVGPMTCTGTGATQVHDNEYFTSTGAIQECGKDLSQWQTEGHDQGSVAAKTPSDADLVAWGKAKLYGVLEIDATIVV